MKIRSRLHQEQTPFQRIEIYATEYFGKAMIIDGFVMLTEKDNFIYHEMMSHPALYWHPHPKRVAIVGGGDCGTLREVLKHQEVAQCIQIELDEPTANLDPANVQRLEALLQDFRINNNAALLWVSHDQRQIQRVSQTHYRMECGRLKPAPVGSHS